MAVMGPTGASHRRHPPIPPLTGQPPYPPVLPPCPPLRCGLIAPCAAPSGCGKSSLLNSLAGRLPKNGKLTGEILVNGAPRTKEFHKSSALLPPGAPSPSYSPPPLPPPPEQSPLHQKGSSARSHNFNTRHTPIVTRSSSSFADDDVLPAWPRPPSCLRLIRTTPSLQT